MQEAEGALAYHLIKINFSMSDIKIFCVWYSQKFHLVGCYCFIYVGSATCVKLQRERIHDKITEAKHILYSLRIRISLKTKLMLGS